MNQIQRLLIAKMKSDNFARYCAAKTDAQRKAAEKELQSILKAEKEVKS